MAQTTYYNAIVYTDYKTTIRYDDITKEDKFLDYVKTHISYTKVFLYRKSGRKTKDGVYCAYNFPNLSAWIWKK